MHVQVVLARQLANQPSQLPLQRLTSEQMQQLKLQVQDHHQRQRQVAPYPDIAALHQADYMHSPSYNRSSHASKSCGGKAGCC